MYNWQYKNWPNFKFDLTRLEEQLIDIKSSVSLVTGAVSTLPEQLQSDALIHIMVAEALKTSEIEGEHYSRIDVVWSIKKNLGLTVEKSPANKHVIGLGDMLMDVRKSYKEPLTEEKLLEWHKQLMQTNKKINSGIYRKSDEPMLIISGPASDPNIHFEAPPSFRVPDEMTSFVNWFNQDNSNEKDWKLNCPPVKAAIAHLYFESIHPFEDGNGRIGRAIAEKALSQGFGGPILISLSKTIEKYRKEYYANLKEAQRKLEITKWIAWFVNIIHISQKETERLVKFIIIKMRFYDIYKNQLNDRQTKVIARMLEEGPDDFKGGINAKKYMSITGCSKATATRDLQDLRERGAISQIGGLGRSTSYSVNL